MEQFTISTPPESLRGELESCREIGEQMDRLAELGHLH